MSDEDERFVAIVGMAGRFPGAADLEQFWANLAGGVESASAGLAAQDEFDAGFFDVPEAEALLLDPQQRVFLETCWSALEDAGCDPAEHRGAIGVYAGGSETEYRGALRAARSRLALVSDWQLRLATGVDFLTSRVAYRLGLTGPAVTVQTACSTALVATHLACQALMSGDCDLALAGGVTVHLWSVDEPVDEDAGLVAADARCHAFDAAAGGTVFANGAGVLVLKRLTDARRDGDRIRAVVRGSAVNNDGAEKIGFSAPSVGGQAAAVRDAHLAAGVDPGTIGYVEAHGTGTPLGDPIEIAALTAAFRQGTAGRGFCSIGSVKTNIGHVDAAAGAAGVIKTVLALEHGLVPASLNFTEPNPRIDFADSPFVVAAEARPWPPGPVPRRAGVNSLGFGGTNAHLVLEEDTGSRAARPAPARPWQLLVVSGRSEQASADAAERLGAHLRAHQETELADAAWTSQVGRRAHEYRRFAVGADHDAVAESLSRPAPPAAAAARPVAFAFPGQGGQRPGMCSGLYEYEPEFRAAIDECAEAALEELEFDLRAAVAGDGVGVSGMAVAQPAVFAVEYGLARLLLAWGIEPDVLVGHSLGAYAAACVAGVFTLPDAMRLVIERGRLLESVAGGAMLAVSLPEAEARALLTADLDLAVVNGPAQCVLAGPPRSIASLRERLAADAVETRLLRIPAAAHSRDVEPVMDGFEKRVARLELRPPRIPLLSELTGTALSADEATSPAYWAGHLRRTVRFDRVLNTLFAEPGRVILEVGPGHALTGIVRRHPYRPSGIAAVPALPHPEEDVSDLAGLLTAVGQLWAAGVHIDWPATHADQSARRRVSLPTYPFQRRRYAVDPPAYLFADTPGASGMTGPAEPMSITEQAAEAAPAAEPPPDGPGGVGGQVAEVFRQLLGTVKVGPDDSFFALGGDSVIAAQAIRLLRQSFEIPLPLRVIFRTPTAGGLTRYIEEQLAASSTAQGATQ